MGKLILVLALGVLLWWLFTKGPLSNQGAAPTPTPAPMAAATATPAPASAPATPYSLIPSLTPATAVSLVPTAPPRMAPRPAAATAFPSLRPVFERACRENQAELTEFSEPSATVVAFTARSRRPTGVGDVLDTLRRQGVLRDIQLNAANPRNGKTSWMFVERDAPMYYGYYKVNVFR